MLEHVVLGEQLPHKTLAIRVLAGRRDDHLVALARQRLLMRPRAQVLGRVAARVLERHE